MASIVGQGLSGTVDLRTIRPLEYGKRTLSFGARGVDADIGALNAGSNQFGYRVNGTFVDQFADDHIGIALAAAYDDEPYQYQQFNAWGYGGAGPNNAQLIGGSKSYVTSTDLKRFGVNGTLEVKATDHFTSTLDGFYSDFREKQHLRGIELPLGFGGGVRRRLRSHDGDGEQRAICVRHLHQRPRRRAQRHQRTQRQAVFVRLEQPLQERRRLERDQRSQLFADRSQRTGLRKLFGHRLCGPE